MAFGCSVSSRTGFVAACIAACTMAFELVKNGDPNAREIDSTVKNRFKWTWFEESVSYRNEELTFSVFKKVAKPGVCFCTLCHELINYGSSGKKALAQHVRKEKHFASHTALKDQTRLLVTAKEGVVATLPEPSDETPGVAGPVRVPLSLRVAHQEVGVYFVRL